MALLSVQDASEGLQSVVFQAAAGGGDQVAQGSRASWDIGVILIVRNTDVAAKTVTVTETTGNARQFIVPATTGIAVIPILGIPYGQLQAITYSAVTGVTVAAVRTTRA